MKKLATLLLGIALFGVMPVRMAAQDADDKKDNFAWHIIVKERDDVDFPVKAYQEALSKAFKSFGDTVEDEASADNITLYIVVGKDDKDDDNDGIPDAQDTDDYGDGFADNGENVTVYDMDKDPTFSKVTNELPDEDKAEGLYLSITSEDGSENVYVTKADSFKPKADEKKDAAQGGAEQLLGHALARQSFFTAPVGQDYPCAQAWDYITCLKNYEVAKEQARKEREEAEKKAKAEAEARAKAEAEANKSKGWVTVLKSGQTLPAEGKVENPAGRFVFQSDGNIVLYDKQNKAKWNSGSIAAWYDGKGKELKMQPDGNLVVFLSDSFSATKEFWNSNTKGNDQAVLQVEWSLFKLRFVGKDGKVIKNLN